MNFDKKDLFSSSHLINTGNDIMDKMTKFNSIDEYHDSFEGDTRKLLDELREIVKNAAPEAEEVISYNMPSFRLNGVLVYYAAHKEHIGFYPTSSPIRVFADELAGYKTSKGAIQFPKSQPIPAELVTKIVQYRQMENLEKARKKVKTPR
jgi:uncharacterized protein YdhG (YjbR/CyaY superfamily)